MIELKEKHCTPCHKDSKPLNTEEIVHFKTKVSNDFIMAAKIDEL